jgi:hypothetical protein
VKVEKHLKKGSKMSHFSWCRSFVREKRVIFGVFQGGEKVNAFSIGDAKK